MSAFHCPTKEEILPQALALLPRGRAWQTNDGGPHEGSILYGFWSAVAEVFEYVNGRLCALREEFWCASHVETHDLWMLEYGLPDACDPYPDLCAKLAALGGARCEDYAAIAARAGWMIQCTTTYDGCGGQAGCFITGADTVGGTIPAAELKITVDLAASSSYQNRLTAGPYAGALQTGLPLDCPPDIEPLKCILARVIHAHLKVTYEAING